MTIGKIPILNHRQLFPKSTRFLTDYSYNGYVKEQSFIIKGKIMKKVSKILLLLVAAGILSSCLQSGVDITVNKDGSGELVQTFKVQREYMAFMSLGEAAGDPNMINRDQLEQMALIMGEGVTLKKVTPSPDDNPYAGYEAVYAFTDITKLKTSPTPMTTPGETVEESDWITFGFSRGNTAKLNIISKESEEDMMEESEEEWESSRPSEEEQAQIDQMKQIYRTMHFWFKIHFNGTISNTNALYSDKSTVTIMDMSFEKIVENDKLFMKLTSEGESDLDKIRGDLEKAGVKVDDSNNIEVSFR